MSFVEELIAIRKNHLRITEGKIRDNFINHPRVPEESLLEIYNKLKAELVRNITSVPEGISFVIMLSENIDECYTLVDMFIKDGVKNFKVSDKTNTIFYKCREFGDKYFTQLRVPFDRDTFRVKA